MLNRELSNQRVKGKHIIKLSQAATSVTLLGGLLASALPVLACGPDFPNRLLTDRQGTLLYMPEGNFAFETARLATVDKQLPMWRAHLSDNAISNQTLSKQTPLNGSSDSDKTSASISIEERQQIARMRASGNVSVAWELGKNLPIAARLYTTGAVAFALRDLRAEDYFRQVLALLDSQQGEWGLKAHYSLGRILMGNYPAKPDNSSSASTAANVIYPSALDANGANHTDDHPNATQLRAAYAQFQQVIDAVRQGEADPDQLALASLGQQARIEFWLGNIPAAAALYAQQAAQGDPQGTLSLQFVASYLVAPQNIGQLQQIIHDPLIRQLVTIELFTRSENLLNGNVDPQGVNEITRKIVTLLSGSAATPATIAESDKLAALAYRSGQYEITDALLPHAGNTGLAWWLRAKMALRHGDIPAATAAYANAAKAFPDNEQWGEQRGNNGVSEMIIPACRVAGEQAILALKRGDYLQAMALLYRGRALYWADVADIAERVLSVDELKTFVDQHVPSPAIPSMQVASGGKADPDNALRELLARRLMRVGRYDEALNYFVSIQYRDWATEYQQLLQQAVNKKYTKIERAMAYYQAAFLLRERGMVLSGYEMTPDYALYEGNYSYLEDAFELPKKSNTLEWLSSAEARRAALALPLADRHFLHYRWQAVALAEKAADLLPEKSEAYAAVLCQAASWVIKRDEKKGRELYQRYRKNGAPYDWASQFGYRCPQPDFSLNQISSSKGQ